MKACRESPMVQAFGVLVFGSDQRLARQPRSQKSSGVNSTETPFICLPVSPAPLTLRRAISSIAGKSHRRCVQGPRGNVSLVESKSITCIGHTTANLFEVMVSAEQSASPHLLSKITGKARAPARLRAASRLVFRYSRSPLVEIENEFPSASR